MNRFRVARAWRGFTLVLGLVMSVASAGTCWAALDAHGDGMAFLVLAAVCGTAGIAMLVQARHWSTREWEIDGRTVRLLEAGAVRRALSLDDLVEAKVRPDMGDVVLRARDGTTLSIPSVLADLVVALSRIELAVMPRWMETTPSVLVGRTHHRGPLLLSALAIASCGLFVIAGPPWARVAGLIGGLMLTMVALAWWSKTNDHLRELGVRDGALLVRYGRRQHRIALDELREWAVVVAGAQPRALLLLVTADDSFSFGLPSASWLAVAAILRRATQGRPQAKWMLEAITDPPPPSPAPPERRTSWIPRMVAAAAVALVLGGAAAMLPAPRFDGATPIERARVLVDEGSPTWAVRELAPWLDRHPDDVPAHRVFLAAHISIPRNGKPMRDDGPVRARYAALSARDDPRLASVGAWGLARLALANGDRTAVDPLCAIDRASVPGASVDCARALIDAGRALDARALLEADDTSPPSLRVPALAEALRALRADDALASLARGPDAEHVPSAMVRALAAREHRLIEWARLQLSGEGAPLPFALAWAMMLAAALAGLARFWAGVRAPSRLASVAMVACGAAMSVMAAAARDLAAARGPLIDDGFGAIFGIVVPLTVVLSPLARRRDTSPVELAARAGLVSAGMLLVSTALVLVHADGGWRSAATFTAARLVLDGLVLPWTVVIAVDLRQRGLPRAAAPCASAAIVALLWYGPSRRRAHVRPTRSVCCGGSSY